MIIYQVHANHGRHIAYSPLEAESNRKAGWKDVTEQEFYGQTKKVESVPPLQNGTVSETSKETPQENSESDDKDTRAKKLIDHMIVAYEKRFGKKPDGRLSLSSIEKALHNAELLDDNRT